MIRLYTIKGYLDITPPPILLPREEGGFSMPGRSIKHALTIFSARVAQELTTESVPYWPWPEADAYLYARLPSLYQDLASLIDPRIECAKLIPQCRHEFFVCTEPVQHPKSPSATVRGLSTLEKMLGMEYDWSESRGDRIGTGDPEVDALVSCLLLFKQSAPVILTTLGAKDVAGALKFASYLSDPERSKNDSAPAIDAAPTVQDQEFFDLRDEILNTLEVEGVEVPPDF